LDYWKIPNNLLASGKFDLNTALDNSAKMSVNMIKGVTTYQTPLVLDGKYPGREIEGKVPEHNGLFRQRIYCANGNFYQTVVIGLKDVVNSRDAYQFLDSFHIK
jgi:hypothetical protein